MGSQEMTANTERCQEPSEDSLLNREERTIKQFQPNATHFQVQ